MNIILIRDGHCYRFDNAAAVEREKKLFPNAVEMTASEIAAAFGDAAHHVGPHNTTVAEDGTITFTYTAPTTDVLAERVRTERDRRIEAVSWRVERYQSETRLGLTPTDDITALDAYIQALRDVPDQAGFPSAVTWPELAEA